MKSQILKNAIMVLLFLFLSSNVFSTNIPCDTLTVTKIKPTISDDPIMFQNIWGYVTL